jgi:hypothetical protein
VDDVYSVRNARIGSIETARHAGSVAASSATSTPSNPTGATPTIVTPWSVTEMRLPITDVASEPSWPHPVSNEIGLCLDYLHIDL